MNGITQFEEASPMQLPLGGHNHFNQRYLSICFARPRPSSCAAKIWQVATILKSTKATVKYMRNMPTSQPQAQVNQLGHQRVNFEQYKKNCKKRKPPHQTG